MRIATYNVNNLFERAKLFELEGFSKKQQLYLRISKRLINFLSILIMNQLIMILNFYWKNTFYTQQRIIISLLTR